MKRLSLLVLAVIMLVAASACSKEKTDPVPSPDTTTWTPDYAAAYAKYTPETVIYSIGGIDIRWDELFAYLAPGVRTITQLTSGEPNFTDPDGIESAAIAYVTEQAVEAAMIKYAAKLNNVTLDEFDISEIQFEIDQEVASLGSQGYADKLWNDFMTLDVRKNHFSTLPILRVKTAEALYGADYASITDAMVASNLDVSDYIHAKFVHFSDKDDALAFISELQASSNPNELFISAGLGDMTAAQYPDGAVYELKDNSPAFVKKAFELREGSYSTEPIEWEYGYTVALRLPQDFNALKYYEDVPRGDTMRSLAALVELDKYISGLTPERITKVDLDIKAIFGK